MVLWPGQIEPVEVEMAHEQGRMGATLETTTVDVEVTMVSAGKVFGAGVVMSTRTTEIVGAVQGCLDVLLG